MIAALEPVEDQPGPRIPGGIEGGGEPIDLGQARQIVAARA